MPNQLSSDRNAEPGSLMARAYSYTTKCRSVGNNSDFWTGSGKYCGYRVSDLHTWVPSHIYQYVNIRWFLFLMERDELTMTMMAGSIRIPELRAAMIMGLIRDVRTNMLRWVKREGVLDTVFSLLTRGIAITSVRIQPMAAREAWKRVKKGFELF